MYSLAAPRTDGYSIKIPSWEMEVIPNGEKVTLNGTIQEVHAQLLQLNPNWDEDFKDRFHSRNTSPFERRADFTGARTDCDREEANPYDIQQGIEYLRRVSGPATNPPGPNVCDRVSCSWSNAILWCNEVRPPLSLKELQLIVTIG